MDNIVRVHRFKWMHAQTEHFDIYYDQADEKLLPRMAHYIEYAWQKNGEKYNYYVKGRTPFFFFSHHNRFEENNIVPIGEGTGGVTEAFKNRLLIFNDGSETWLRHVIPHEFTHVIQFNVFYGGFWKSVRLLKSPFYALWAMEGMAEYGSGEVDAPTSDMIMRDAVYTQTLIPLPELQGFNHVKPNQVTLGYKTGEAAIQFLADEYGREKVGEFLTTMEKYFDVSSALEDLLGTDLNRFDLRFREWLEEKYADFYDHAKPPTYYGAKLTSSDEIPQFNEAPAVSADGKKIYYMSDIKGPMRIYEYDVESQKSRLLLDVKWSSFEYLHPDGHAMSVSHDGRWLSFSSEKIQQDFLYLFNLETEKLKRVKVPFDQIRSPVFSPNDQALACVGMKEGYNDIYLINYDGEVLKRLTNNPQDERDLVFSLDGKKLVYSGEVMSLDGNEPQGRDLYEISLAGGEPQRILDLAGEEREPAILPDGSIVFTRDQDDQGNLGFNLYHWDPRTGVEQITDMVGGAFSARYNPTTNQLYYVGFYGGEKHLYDMSSSTFTAQFKSSLAASSEVPFEPGLHESHPGEDIIQDAQAKAMTQAIHTWSEGLVSPLLQGEIKPYQWKGSTDLFLPFFFYSSLDGLVLADIWQYSDYVGNHQLSQQMQYASGNDFIDLAVIYSYSRFRPTISLAVRTQRFYRDLDEMEQRTETDGILLASYPLDRIQALQLGVGSSDQKDRYFDGSQPDENQMDRFWMAGYVYDTVTGRYLVPTQGHRLSLLYQQGTDVFAGNQRYKSGVLHGAKYFSLPRQSTFVGRFLYGRSVGDEPQEFRLGGSDRIRALNSDSDEFKKFNVVLTSMEFRYRLAYLNARTKWLYPDFFFKAAYGVIFDDIGYGWDNSPERDKFQLRDASNSAGVGIYWPTFIIQSFLLNIGVQWAVNTNSGSQVWYITLGPTF